MQGGGLSNESVCTAGGIGEVTSIERDGFFLKADLLKMNERFCAAMAEAGYLPSEPRTFSYKQRYFPCISISFKLPWPGFYMTPLPLTKSKPMPTKIRPSRMRLLALQVADKHGLTVEDMRSECRKQRFGRARQEFYYRARTELARSYPQIGRFLNKDHSTVIHGLKKFAERTGLAT